MKKKYLGILIGLIIFSLAWIFVGFDRYVGDHEVGSWWTPFIKSAPTSRIFFHNPAQYTLDREPFDSLDDERKEQFIQYCYIRYGTKMPYDCEILVEARRIK
ncbi:hypothetical protein [Acidovorax sp. LjRoot117]|jgi:hypothetical protein|uniref:hypothetical protein n=1 Tax=Acidovorax sp. LjRoot117 TaxID=3342255 RepID=UPI003ECEA37D